MDQDEKRRQEANNLVDVIDGLNSEPASSEDARRRVLARKWYSGNIPAEYADRLDVPVQAFDIGHALKEARDRAMAKGPYCTPSRSMWKLARAGFALSWLSLEIGVRASWRAARATTFKGR